MMDNNCKELENFEKIKYISHGSFGEVHLV